MSVIELSKSSRAKCKVCKGKIDKAVPRYGEEYEFRMGGETRSGIGWYHFDCAVKSRAENVVLAEIGEGIPQDLLDKISELRTKANRSAFTVKWISEIEEDGKQVNCKGTVLRVMKPLQGIHPNGSDAESKTIYVEHEKVRRKILLWDQHIDFEMEKGDTLVIIKGYTDLGSDDKIQVNAIFESEVHINPSDDELSDSIPTVEIFQSDKWERPKGKFCLFESAKTSRAACVICEAKIMKGDLKIIKPIWAENEKTKQMYPGNRSYHINCAEQDEHGSEILLEAISRLNPEIMGNNQDALLELLANINNKNAKKALENLVN